MIEFEKVQTIRKRLRTRLAMCKRCAEMSDVVPLIEAAELFETDYHGLFSFVRQYDCHYQITNEDGIFLCVTSLIERMKGASEFRRLKAKESMKNAEFI